MSCVWMDRCLTKGYNKTGKFRQQYDKVVSEEDGRVSGCIKGSEMGFSLEKCVVSVPGRS